MMVRSQASSKSGQARCDTRPSNQQFPEMSVRLAADSARVHLCRRIFDLPARRLDCRVRSFAKSDLPRACSRRRPAGRASDGRPGPAFLVPRSAPESGRWSWRSSASSVRAYGRSARRRKGSRCATPAALSASTGALTLISMKMQPVAWRASFHSVSRGHLHRPRGCRYLPLQSSAALRAQSDQR